MNADGGVDEIMLLGELNATVQRSRPRPTADGDNGLHAGLTRPRQYLLAVSAELLHLEMGVGVYENQSSVVSHQSSVVSQKQPMGTAALGRSRRAKLGSAYQTSAMEICNLQSEICNLQSSLPLLHSYFCLLFQPHSRRHILQEAAQHRLSTLGRRRHDHSVRLQPAQLPRREIGHDHDLSPDQ